MITVQGERHNFKIGDHVVYKLEGIYEIVDIRLAQFGRLPENNYYVLCAVNDSRSRVYVPVDYDSGTRIREVIKISDIDKVIENVKNYSQEWIQDPKRRAADFNDKLCSGDLSLCLWVVEALKIYQELLISKGKKMYASDERALDSCRRYVYTELSYITGFPLNSIEAFIKSKLEDSVISVPGLKTDW